MKPSPVCSIVGLSSEKVVNAVVRGVTRSTLATEAQESAMIYNENRTCILVWTVHEGVAIVTPATVVATAVTIAGDAIPIEAEISAVALSFAGDEFRLADPGPSAVEDVGDIGRVGVGEWAGHDAGHGG